MSVNATKTVVLIHGAWMTPESWDNFRKPFEEAGYIVHAPTWPLLGRGTAAELRASPPAGLGSLTIGRIVDHYEKFIRALPVEPLLIGHSFGGLFVQKLLDRGVGAAGVAIDPGPIGGIIPGPVSLAAAFPVLARWNAWNRPYTLTKKGFDKTFANTAPATLRDEAYERLVVPTSGRIFLQAATGVGAFVSPKRRTQPLLIAVGEKDRTVTPYLARAAWKKQKKSAARTDFKQFPGLSHFLIAEPGWENVAGYAFDWARSL